jgi:ketol-acid reductoisomerase
MTAIETHLAIKKTFWVETTTDLSTSEFKSLMELIQELWKTKFEVVIPNPSSVEDLKNLETYLF